MCEWLLQKTDELVVSSNSGNTGLIHVWSVFPNRRILNIHGRLEATITKIRWTSARSMDTGMMMLWILTSISNSCTRWEKVCKISRLKTFAMTKLSAEHKDNSSSSRNPTNRSISTKKRPVTFSTLKIVRVL